MIDVVGCWLSGCVEDVRFFVVGARQKYPTYDDECEIVSIIFSLDESRCSSVPAEKTIDFVEALFVCVGIGVGIV